MKRTSILFCMLLALGACKSGQKASGEAGAPAGNPHVVLETNMGDITIELFADKAPLSSKNFLEYVDSGFYEGTTFHRVIGSFMIQGGGFDDKFKKKKTNPPVKNEATNGLSNTPGTLAMARTSQVDSATSQFFINVADNSRLDHKGKNPAQFGYAVFGKVVDGMDAVNRIKEVPTCPGAGKICKTPLPPGMRDVPAEPIIIQRARRK